MKERYQIAFPDFRRQYVLGPPIKHHPAKVLWWRIKRYWLMALVGGALGFILTYPG